MDEPLKQLDLKISSKFRDELIKIHQTLNKTFVYATENVRNAMIMATKIAIMNKSKIVQIDLPVVLYEKPVNLFVAQYFGFSVFNLWKGQVVNNQFVSFSKLIKCDLSQKQLRYLKAYNILEISLGARAESIKISPKKGDSNFKAQISTIKYLGKEHHIHGFISDHEKVTTTILNNKKLEKVRLSKKTKIINFKFNLQKNYLFDSKNGQTIWP